MKVDWAKWGNILYWAYWIKNPEEKIVWLGKYFFIKMQNLEIAGDNFWIKSSAKSDISKNDDPLYCLRINEALFEKWSIIMPPFSSTKQTPVP